LGGVILSVITIPLLQGVAIGTPYGGTSVNRTSFAAYYSGGILSFWTGLSTADRRADEIRDRNPERVLIQRSKQILGIEGE